MESLYNWLHDCVKICLAFFSIPQRNPPTPSWQLGFTKAKFSGVRVFFRNALRLISVSIDATYLWVYLYNAITGWNRNCRFVFPIVWFSDEDNLISRKISGTFLDLCVSLKGNSVLNTVQCERMTWRFNNSKFW